VLNDKARALVDLSRERALDVIGHALGGRLRRAA
jgi:hypothetical protein